MVEPHSSNFRVITTNFLGGQIFRKFTVDIDLDRNKHDSLFDPVWYVNILCNERKCNNSKKKKKSEITEQFDECLCQGTSIKLFKLFISLIYILNVVIPSKCYKKKNGVPLVLKFYTEIKLRSIYPNVSFFAQLWTMNIYYHTLGSSWP